MKHLILILIISLSMSPRLLFAQEVISSGGSYATGTGVSLSWTVGEPVIATFTNGGFTLTQGFHQTRLGTTSIDNIPIPGLIVSVYPNPFYYVLHLRVDEGDFSQLQYSLLNIQGQTLVLEKISRNLTDIDMQTFAAGNFLLQVRGKSGEIVKSFKVVKYQ